MRIDLPYGSRPCAVELGERPVEVLRARELPKPPPLEALIEAALDAPVGGPSLAGARVTAIVSDSTRVEPRAAFLRALRRRLPSAQLTIAIATGTHGPSRVDELDLPRDARIVNHDGHSDCVELGVTARGTPVRVHRCLLETDLVVATGCIRPHYFAGFGAGAKAIFPGLGERAAIRINHRWKTDARSRAGIVDGNPCRDDIEEAVALVPTPCFLLDGVGGPDGAIHGVVAGDVRAAFRAGAALARPWFEVRARPARLVIASDGWPVTASLYQAAKIAAAAAPLVAEGGLLAVVAECPEGVGPLDVVNEAIFRIGVLPRLAASVRLALVSSLAPQVVRETLLEPIEPRFTGSERALVMPHASQLICEPNS
ncbi:MAG TPA: lactate racemase domain-containing protein [Kofleriaceae bacterium]|jgi:nickel-dependent lactate racemase